MSEPNPRQAFRVRDRVFIDAAFTPRYQGSQGFVQGVGVGGFVCVNVEGKKGGQVWFQKRELAPAQGELFTERTET